jgi:quinol monooxygenase YgiN
MVDIHIRLKVRDFNVFWQVFRERGAPLRERHGSRGARVFRSQDDPRVVHLHFSWESRERFGEFLQDPEVQEAMLASTKYGNLEIEHLDQVGELPN